MFLRNSTHLRILREQRYALQDQANRHSEELQIEFKKDLEILLNVLGGTPDDIRAAIARVATRAQELGESATELDRRRDDALRTAHQAANEAYIASGTDVDNTFVEFRQASTRNAQLQRILNRMLD